MEACLERDPDVSLSTNTSRVHVPHIVCLFINDDRWFTPLSYHELFCCVLHIYEVQFIHFFLLSRIIFVSYLNPAFLKIVATIVLLLSYAHSLILFLRH